MTSRFPPPPPPSGIQPAGDADVIALLQTALIREVSLARAASDLQLLAQAAKDTANVTAFTPRRERAFQRVAAAAVVVVVASGAGFGLAQFGGGTPQDPRNADALALETPSNSANTDALDQAELGTSNGSQDGAGNPLPEALPDANADALQSAAPRAPATGNDSTVSQPASPRQEAPVGDAGESETIDEFARDDTNESTDASCEVDEVEDEACDANEPVDTTDPRNGLRERRFGAN